VASVQSAAVSALTRWPGLTYSGLTWRFGESYCLVCTA